MPNTRRKRRRSQSRGGFLKSLINRVAPDKPLPYQYDEYNEAMTPCVNGIPKGTSDFGRMLSHAKCNALAIAYAKKNQSDIDKLGNAPLVQSQDRSTDLGGRRRRRK